METWTIVLAVITVLISIYYFFRRENFFEKHDIAHIKFSLRSYISSRIFGKHLITDGIKGLYNIHPESKYIGFYDLTTPITVVRDPDLIKSIGVKNFEHFVDRRMFIDPDQERLFQKNLSALNGEEWRERRSLLSPAFTSSRMKAMFKLMSECGENFVKFITNETKDKPITYETRNIFNRYTNDVIATYAFGVTVDSMKNPKNEFYTLGRQINITGKIAALKRILMRSVSTLTKLLKVQILDKKLETFFTEIVRSTVEMRDKEGIVRPDMLQLMMETRNGKSQGHALSIPEMTAQAFMFFLAGYHAPTSVMCFVAHHIANDREIQRKLQQEVDEIYEKDNQRLTYEGLNSMPYLDAIINEAMRMYPVAVAVDRVCTKAFEIPPALPGKKSVLLKPGDCILIPIYGLHMDSKYFPDPEKFHPERFIDVPKEILHSSTFFPFGVGPRTCIGNRFSLLQMKTLIFHLILKCTLKVGDKMVMPMKLANAGFSVAAEGGFWLTLESRNKW